MEVALRYLHQFVVVVFMTGSVLFSSTPSLSDFVFHTAGWSGQPYYTQQGTFSSCVVSTSDANRYLVLLKLQTDWQLSRGRGDFVLSQNEGAIVRTFRIARSGVPVPLIDQSDISLYLQRTPDLAELGDVGAVLQELLECVEHSQHKHLG